MLLPPEVAAVIHEIRGEPGCHNDLRLLCSARSYARFVRQTMKIGLTALTLRPSCVLGVFFVKKKGESPSAHRCPPSVELLSGDGLSRLDVDASGLVHGESLGLHYRPIKLSGQFVALYQRVSPGVSISPSPQIGHD